MKKTVPLSTLVRAKLASNGMPLSVLNALQELKRVLKRADLNYRINELIQAVESATQPFYATRDELMKEHQVPVDGKAGRFRIPDEKLPEIEAALREMADANEIEIKVPTIKLTDFIRGTDPITQQPLWYEFEHFDLLDWLIVDEHEMAKDT